MGTDRKVGIRSWGGSDMEEGIGDRGTGTDSGRLLGLRWTRKGSLPD